MVRNYLEDLFEMKGAFVITRGMDETQIYSKSIKDFSKIKIIADLIATFDHNKFFKSISGPGFTQIDYMKYDNYQIYFARVTSDHAVFILFADTKQSFDQVVSTITRDLRSEMNKITQRVSMIPSPVFSKQETEEVEEDVNETKDEPNQELTNTRFNIPMPGI
jgi:hypothetical protein